MVGRRGSSTTRSTTRRHCLFFISCFDFFWSDFYDKPFFISGFDFFWSEFYEVGFFCVEVLAPAFFSSRGMIFFVWEITTTTFFCSDYLRPRFFSVWGIHEVGFFGYEVFTRWDFFSARYQIPRFFRGEVRLATTFFSARYPLTTTSEHCLSIGGDTPSVTTTRLIVIGARVCASLY